MFYLGQGRIGKKKKNKKEKNTHVNGSFILDQIKFLKNHKHLHYFIKNASMETLPLKAQLEGKIWRKKKYIKHKHASMMITFLLEKR